MDKSTESSERKANTPITTDDESISLTTSVASDSLDSWTLVTEKQKNPNTIETENKEDENRIENLPKCEELDMETSHSKAEEEQETEPSPEHYEGTTSATDEFSDEVSIISESENGDISTPHPYLPEHLQTLNLKFTTGEGLDLATLLQQQQQEEHRLQQKHKLGQISPSNIPIQLQQRSNNNNGSYQARQRKRQRSPSVDETQETNKTQVVAPTVPVSNHVQCIHQPRAFIRRTYTVFFYVLVALVILGFYGKLSFPEWPLFSGDSPSSVSTLEKKLIDMELQNNLMRAEIDLLTKQVNHLKTKNPNNEKKQYAKDEWKYNGEGNWNAYKAYKTDEPNDNVVDDIENTKEQSKTLDKETTTTHTENEKKLPIQDTPEITKNPTSTDETKQEKPPKYYDNDDRLLKERFNKHNGKKIQENSPKNEGKLRKREGKDENFKRQNKKYNSKERDEDDNSKERKNFRRNSKERYNDKDNRNEDRNSQENKDYKRYNDHYKMHHQDHHNNDHHRYHNGHNDIYNNQYHHGNHHQKHHRDHSCERFIRNNQNNGEWHEKLMQQREKARNEQEQRLNHEKNWYLNRKNGREQWRSDEMNTR